MFDSVDLHSHTLASDGQLSADQLVRRAHAHHVQLLAITDHDSLAAIAEAKQTASELGVQLVPGVEISSRWGNVGIHILGLAVDVNCAVLCAGLQAQQQARRARAQNIGLQLERFNIKGAYEGALAIAGEGQLGRLHFAQHLVNEGHAKDIPQAFKRYLGNDRLAKIHSQWAPLGDVVAWIKAAKGWAVLAHPVKYRLAAKRLRVLVQTFKEAGGDGLEVVTSGQQPEDAQRLASLCEQYDLLASCGSDFHSPDKPWAELGRIPPLPKICRPIWQQWSSFGVVSTDPTGVE